MRALLPVLALAACDVPRPIEGRWQLVEKRLASDGCQLVPAARAGDPCQLSCEMVTARATGADTWEMTFGERGGTAQCREEAGPWFTCTVEDTRGPADARVHRVDTMEGRRHEDGSLRGVFSLQMDCTGPGCTLQPAFRGGGVCETRGTFRGEWRGAL